jgi:hypothetical protein
VRKVGEEEATDDSGWKIEMRERRENPRMSVGTEGTAK